MYYCTVKRETYGSLVLRYIYKCSGFFRRRNYITVLIVDGVRNNKIRADIEKLDPPGFFIIIWLPDKKQYVLTTTSMLCSEFF